MSEIKVENVFKAYGPVDVLKGINLTLPHGQKCVIRGASGSGKSTLLYLMGGLDKPTKGRVLIGDTDLAKLSDKKLSLLRNCQVGFVFQFHFLLSSMNCLDNILLPAKIGGVPLNAVKDEVHQLADRLGVEHCLKKYPYEISGGEQQRINIIRAVSLKPKLLLCDEPTGNLDSKNSEKVIGMLREISSTLGSTLVVVTHDEHIASCFEKRITIEDGQILN